MLKVPSMSLAKMDGLIGGVMLDFFQGLEPFLCRRQEAQEGVGGGAVRPGSHLLLLSAAIMSAS